MGFSPRLSAGRNLAAKAEGEVEALIGAGVAKSMNVKVGDGLTSSRSPPTAPSTASTSRSSGIVNTGIKELDARYLRITLASAQRLLQSDRVTNLVVGLDTTENTDKVAAAFDPRLQGLSQKMELQEMD